MSVDSVAKWSFDQARQGTLMSIGEFQRETVLRKGIVLIDQSKDRIGQERRFRLFAIGQYG